MSARRFSWLLTCLLVACATPRESPTTSVPAVANEAARNSARVHTELAAAYYQRGQYGVSLEELRKALSADARYAPAHYMLGVLNMELKDDVAAESAFRQAIAIEPDNAEARNNFGWFLCTRKRHDESLEQFNAALRNPLYATPDTALTNAGQCARDAGRLAEARAYFERALNLNPRQTKAMLDLADIHHRDGRPSDARRMLDRLHALSEPSPQSLWLGVRVARGLGDRDMEASQGAKLRKYFPDAVETGWLLSGREP